MEEKSSFRNYGVLAIFKMRFLLAYRNKMSFFLRFIMPIIYLVLSTVLQNAIQGSVKTDTNVFPVQNLNINPYASTTSKFILINNTGSNLDSLINRNLIVNTVLNDQPFDLLDDETNFLKLSHSSGLRVNQWPNDMTILYNDSALLSVPYVLHVLTNFLSRLDNITTINASITSFPKINEELNLFDPSTFTSLLMLGFAMILPAVTFAVEIVYDKETKAKNQLLLSGCGFLKYWGSSMLAYLLQYSITPILLLILIFSIPQLNIAAFSHAGAAGSLIILFIVFMPCLTLVAFCCTFLFQKKETAISVLNTVFILAYLIPYMAVSFTQFESFETSDTLHIVFTIIDPIYAIMGGLLRIGQIHLTESAKQAALGNKSVIIPASVYFQFNNFKLPLSYIAGIFHLIIFGVLLYFLDCYSRGINLLTYIFEPKRMTMQRKNMDIPTHEDDDIRRERDHVANADLSVEPLVLEELRKEFDKPQSFSDMLDFKKRGKNDAKKKKVAVRNFTLSFKTSEVFGLLGPNGAGKTTVMNVITADQRPDYGKVTVCGEQLSIRNLKKFYNNIAFCPQHNPLWDELTLFEHLELYAAIKGIEKNRIKEECNQIMHLLQITEHKNKKSAKLSGGTKRKLTFAMSMFATPRIILLDEPSTGMDPQSKRVFWDVITKTFENSDKCGILTTHSMEEAEALCQRIGIMVKGELKCLGSSQYLKERYGTGYTLEAKIIIGNETKFTEFVQHLFENNAKLQQNFSDHYLYSVPKEYVKSLANVFDSLERAKSSGIVQEYSFSQCSLEQVFIEFAKLQEQDDDKN